MFIRDLREIERWEAELAKLTAKEEDKTSVNISRRTIAGIICLLSSSEVILKTLQESAVEPMNTKHLDKINFFKKTFDEDVNDLIVDLIDDILGEKNNKEHEARGLLRNILED